MTWFRRQRSRSAIALAIATFLVGATVWLAPPSNAFLFVNPAPSFPDSTVVGQTAPAALGIANNSTDPEAAQNPVLTISAIDLYPACTSGAQDCLGGTSEAGVFALSPTGTGSSTPAGNATCEGTWQIVPDTGDPTTATRYRFIPPGGEGTLQLPTGTTCAVSFTYTTLRVPTIDTQPGLPGVQTQPTASSTADGAVALPFRNSSNTTTTVVPASPELTTVAAQNSPMAPGTTTDTATLSPAPPPSSGLGAPPTGTITFNLYGPDDPNCAGAVFFTDTVPVNGFGDYTSGPATVSTPGTYRWVASYSGDANYNPANTLCNDPNENVTFTPAVATIVTQATPQVTIGSPITDTATVTGAPAPAPPPTGTVTFTVFGPDDATCAGPPVFTSANRPLGGGPPPTATSEPFTPTAPGTYRWIASYSGDGLYGPVTSSCNDANETSVVIQAVATIVTQATPTVPFGGSITDTATVTGAPAPAPTPTGTVTFTVFGPDNATCTGAPIFTSANRPLGGGPPPTATSAPFTPTAAGTYRWIAAYSGDANYAPVTSSCNDANETSVVTQVTPTIVTQATPTVPFGGSITDTATVTGSPAPAPAPTGTVTFTVFGPNNATCTGVPVFTSANRPLGGGPPPTATSDPFTPTQAGTYRWIASYSGDANYAAVTSSCNDANETSVVSQVTPTIVTSATPTTTIGSPISDTATVTGAPAPAAPPTGTVTFTVFGPDDATCAGAPVFNSGPRPLGGGPPPTATSGPFTPTSPGTYRWIAVYSGDANYSSVTSPCNAPAETSVVNQAVATIVTQATPAVTIGSPITDTATVTGGPAPAPAPTGTVTFTVFGPDNATCTGAPIFTSATRPLSGGPPPTATSAPFTPSAVGTYRWIASYSGDTNYAAVTSSCNDANESSVVNQAVATIATQATPTVTIGSPISDTAVVTGAPAPAPTPTGTVTFTLFGPDNATCAGAPIFTSAARPLGGGPPPTATSAPFTPTAPGSYRWIAAYSGDANYAAVTSSCNDANETSVVNQGVATIVTQATPATTIGSPITDTATVTGAPAPAPAPTGTVTFTVFGPDNATCTGAPVFTSAARPLGGGPPPTATSEPFTPTAPGSYRWIAAYSGDANYPAVTSACNDANETSVVNQGVATIVTQATPTVTVGSPITDTATVTGAPAPAPAPTGTVTFTVFGPDNATCTGAPIFTSAARPLGGGPPPTATSEPFTPTAPGSYRWIAAYSGDANYPAVTSACNDANETSVVTQAVATIVTQATPATTVGSPITDTATVTGSPAPAPAPTGTVTFTVFGPNNATCSGAPIFTSAARPLGGGPPATATSEPFTPAAPGTYRWIASYSGDANYAAVTSSCNDANETSVVNQAVATIATQALGPVTIGSPITDTATVTGSPAPAPPPTGTVTFTVFGPNNTTCAGAPIFTSAARPLTGGPPPTATSAPFTPGAPGDYRWIAAYSGDGNYAPVTSSCNDANETSVVTTAPVAIATQATPNATIGSPISDVATVTGAPAPAPTPTGTVTFTVFGPDNPTCTGAPIFTSANRPIGGGPPPTATSEPFTPTAVGAYRWVAVYSGDANYPTATSPCNAPAETSVVAQSVATIVTSATPTVTIGSPISDTATVSGGPAPAPPPTGSVVFTLFGPDNATCTGAPIFTSAAQPLAGGPPPTANSGPFTPTAPGTYRWIAAYSGDANYPAVTSSCNDANEASVVAQGPVAITTTATPTVTIGSPVTDVATVTGAPAPAPTPTGTVTFTVFGPDNATCTGAPVFTSAARPLGGGPPPTATSDPFTPTAPGSYRWIAAYSGDANYPAVTSACNDANETSVVTQAPVAIVTQATPTTTIGSPITDVATVTGGAAPAPPPTGTVTFTVFGPDNATCTGAPIFTSAGRPLGGGPPPTATSDPFTPTAPGTYRWIAAYSGDANYPAVTSACNDANETSVVAQGPVAIVTQATPTVTIGNPITDVATVTGGAAPAPAPTGTVTFTLFGPDNATCTGAPIFTSATRPLGGGPPPTATSEPFTPTAPGSYRWIAAYSGDANYPAVTSACNDANETSVVTQAAATIVTQATPTVTVGSPISDVATVTGGAAPAPAPTGTVTFTVFGPDDATCAGPVVFTSAARPLGGGPPPTATSEPFTPTAPGSYRWIAAYSGDANYPAVTSLCNDANETSVVAQAVATIVTQATPVVTIGSPISDVATVTGAPAPAPLPTGTVTFTLFGPDDPTCASPAIFTSAARPLTGPPPAPPAVQATSEPFTPTAVGTYNWIAVYSGDANYPTVTSPCGAPNEASVVNPGAVSIVTAATGPVTLGDPISDVATVTGDAAPAPAPTGTVTFTLFGPGNPTCTGAPIFTSANRPLAGGPPPTAVSEEFTPTAAGTYQWVAVYSGDANYPAATSPCGAPGEASVVTPLPIIQVDKTATPPSRTAPGGDFTFNVVVTNTSNEVLTITSLTDDVYGDITTRANSTCTTAIGTVLQPSPGPGNTYSCSFTAPFTGAAGDSQTDVVTVRATNPTGTEVTDSDDAVVTLTPLPVIQVDKTATPPSRTAPGGDFTFNVVVTNTSNEVLTITSLTDDVYGDITTRASSTCNTAIGTVLQPSPGPGNTYSCSFTAPFTGVAGDSQTDVVTVRATNPQGVEVTDSDDAVVTLTPVPVIQVVKTATPTSRPAPGGNFTFDVVVTNTSTEVLTITSLTDDVYGDITTRPNSTCTTAIGTVLQPGGTYSCAFSAPFNGVAGDSQTDVVTVRATNPTGVEVTDSDDAVVTLTSVPVIQVVKTATPTSRPAPGGDFTFDVVVTNTSTDVLTITSLTDDVYGDITTRAGSTCNTAIGTVLQPGGTYSCSFTAPFTGAAGSSQTDVVTVRATNPAGTEVTDNDDAVVTLTPAPTIQVVKTATPLTRPEPGGDFTFNVVVTNTSTEVLTITALTDDVYGNITTRANSTCNTAIGTVLQPGGTYSCSFTAPFFGNAGASQTDVVTVRATNPTGVEVTDNDDAVVFITNVVPAIHVDKTATPSTRPEPGGAFTFNVVVTNIGSETLTITALTDDVYGNLATRGTCTTAIGTVLAPGASYSCSFSGDFFGNAGASQTDVVTVRGRDDEGTEVTDADDATVSLTNVPPTIVVVKDARPTTMPAPGGTFTFDVAVTNTSFEPVTITALTDNIYGNLNGRGTCRIGAVLQPGQTYRCSFPGDFTGVGGAAQTDRVTATAVDNDNTSVTAFDDATVNLTDVPVVVIKVPPPKVVQKLVRTGSDLDGPALLAIALLAAGTMMVAAAAWYRRPRWATAHGPVSEDTTWFSRPSSRGGKDALLGGAGFGGGPPDDPQDSH